MVANVRIIHDNLIDRASNLASTPACATAMPISNVQLARRGAAARIVAATTWAITGEISGTASALCLVGHNLTGAATVRLRLYSDFAKTTEVYDSTALAVGTALPWGTGGLQWGVTPWGASSTILDGTPAYFSHWFADETTAVAFQIDIADATNTDGYLQIGRIYLGDYWEPSVNVTYGMGMQWREASKQHRTDGGSLRTEGYYPYRSYSASFDALTDTDREEWNEITRKLGTRLDFLVSFAPEAGGKLERDYMAACKFTSTPKVTAAAYGRYESPAEMEEI